MSPSTRAAIHRIELDREELWTGVTARSLYLIRLFLRRPLLAFYWIGEYCICDSCSLDDPLVARDHLATVHSALRGRPRREFAATLARLDAELWRRTLPAPGARGEPGDAGWWRGRLTGP